MAVTQLLPAQVLAQSQQGSDRSGELTRENFSVGSCQVGTMRAGWRMMLFGGAAVGGGIRYWEPAGEDCSFVADIKFEVSHQGSTQWILLRDTIKRPPRFEVPRETREILKRDDWNKIFCESDGSSCLSEEEAKKWWNDGFEVTSFDFTVSGSSSSSPSAPAAAPQKPSANPDWVPKVEWHPSPLPPSSPKRNPPEERPPEAPGAAVREEPEPEARTVEIQPLPELHTYEETAGRESAAERQLKDAIANHKSSGPSLKLPGTGAFGLHVGSSPMGKRVSARMDGLLTPIYVGLGAGMADVDGNIAYYGDDSLRTSTDPDWGPMLTGSLGFSVMPPLCRVLDGVKNCSGIGLGVVGEFLHHSGNVESKTIEHDFLSWGPELYVQIAVLRRLALTSHVSYRWLKDRPDTADSFEDSGFFFDFGVAYLEGVTKGAR